MPRGDEVGKAAEPLTFRQFKGQGDLIAASHLIGGRGCTAVSEVVQGKDAVEQGDDKHTDHICASEPFCGLGGLWWQGQIPHGREAVLFQPCCRGRLPTEGQPPQPENTAVQNEKEGDCSRRDEEQEGLLPVVVSRIVKEQHMCGVAEVQQGKAAVTQIQPFGGLVDAGRQQQEQRRVEIAFMHAHGAGKDSRQKQRAEQRVFPTVVPAADAVRQYDEKGEDNCSAAPDPVGNAEKGCGLTDPV